MEISKDEVKELINSIERIPQFEEKLGINIENLSVKADETSINIIGDFFMEDDKKEEFIEQYNTYFLKLFATFYDIDNNIIDSNHTVIELDKFLGFANFEIFVYPINVRDIKRIRFYPNTY